MSTGDLLVGALIGAGLVIVYVGLKKSKEQKFKPDFPNYGIANMGFDTDEASIVGSNFNSNGTQGEVVNSRNRNFYNK